MDSGTRPTRDELLAYLADVKVHRQLLLDGARAVVVFHAPHGKLSPGGSSHLESLRESVELVESEIRRGR